MDDAQKGLGFEEDRSDPASAARGKCYLFVIGINQYTRCPQLYNAVRDAKVLIKVVTGKYQFKAGSYLTTLFDQDATIRNIYRQLEQLALKVGSDDTLLIYFSGHGTYNKIIKEGFWVPVDGDIDNPGSAIPNSSIVKYLKAINALHIIVISDACFSGTLFAEKSTGAASGSENIPSRWLMSSGRNEPVLDGQPGDHSPFAKSLITQLVRNQSKVLPVSMLGAMVKEGVSYNSTQTPRCEPLHGVGHEGGEPAFRIKNAAWVLDEEDLDIIADPIIPEIGTSGMKFWLIVGLVVVGLLGSAWLFTYLPRKESGPTSVEPNTTTVSLPTSTTLKNSVDTINLGVLAPGQLSKFEFSITNEGSITAKQVSFDIPCSNLAITSHPTDSISARQVVHISGVWTAGDITGKQHCTLVINADNITSSLHIHILAEVKSASITLPASPVITAPQPNIILPDIEIGKSENFSFTLRNEGKAASKRLDVTLEYDDGAIILQSLDGIAPQKSKAYTLPFSVGNRVGTRSCILRVKGYSAVIFIQTEVKSSPVISEPECPVYCQTSGISGITIWFIDSNKKMHKMVSDDTPTVMFMVPCSMLDLPWVEVHFSKGGPEKSRPVTFNDFQIPSEFKNQK